MKYYITLIILILLYSSCAPKLSTNIFQEFTDAKPKIGQGKNDLKGEIFESIYKKHSTHKNFEKILFDFLESSEDGDLYNYYWIGSSYLSGTFEYTNLNNIELAEKVLLKGIEDVNKRISRKDNTQETRSKLIAQRCGIYWITGLHYFEFDKPEIGSKYFDLAKDEKEENCGYMFPAIDRETEERVFNQYKKYKK